MRNQLLISKLLLLLVSAVLVQGAHPHDPTHGVPHNGPSQPNHDQASSQTEIHAVDPQNVVQSHHNLDQSTSTTTELEIRQTKDNWQTELEQFMKRARFLDLETEGEALAIQDPLLKDFKNETSETLGRFFDHVIDAVTLEFELAKNGFEINHQEYRKKVNAVLDARAKKVINNEAKPPVKIYDVDEKEDKDDDEDDEVEKNLYKFHQDFYKETVAKHGRAARRFEKAFETSDSSKINKLERQLVFRRNNRKLDMKIDSSEHFERRRKLMKNDKNFDSYRFGACRVRLSIKDDERLFKSLKELRKLEELDPELAKELILYAMLTVSNANNKKVTTLQQFVDEEIELSIKFLEDKKELQFRLIYPLFDYYPIDKTDKLEELQKDLMKEITELNPHETQDEDSLEISKENSLTIDDPNKHFIFISGYTSINEKLNEFQTSSKARTLMIRDIKNNKKHLHSNSLSELCTEDEFRELASEGRHDNGKFFVDLLFLTETFREDIFKPDLDKIKKKTAELVKQSLINSKVTGRTYDQNKIKVKVGYNMFKEGDYHYVRVGIEFPEWEPISQTN